MTKLKEYKMYINGAWVDAENKKTFKSLNPENNEPWAFFPEDESTHRPSIYILKFSIFDI